MKNLKVTATFIALLLTVSLSNIHAEGSSKADVNPFILTELNYFFFDSVSENLLLNENILISDAGEMIFEKVMELEDWMLEINWIESEEIIEEDLQLESWMQSPKNWNTNPSR